MKSTPTTSIFVILARESRRAVVFRRGPSKKVMLALWRTDSDEFEEGQWLTGRIYERRCDLSPDGEFLLYFAANYREPLYSWTAISKPPRLTALALWPKGDGWGGGGLFADKRTVELNHRPNESKLADGFALPVGIETRPFGERSGWGEDSPVHDQRRIRDGWRQIATGRIVEKNRLSKIWIVFEPPIIWSRPNPRTSKLELRETTRGLHEKNGPWYVMEFVVKDARNDQTIELGRADWADWDVNGDLLFAKDGRIFRLGLSTGATLASIAEAKQLIDFSDRRFPVGKSDD